MASYLEREQLVPIQQVLPASESMLREFQTKLDLYGRGASMINAQESRLRQTNFTRESSKNTFNSLMNQVERLQILLKQLMKLHSKLIF